MQRLGRWVLSFLVFVTVVGTVVLTAVPLHADELKQEETVTELITPEEMKEQIKEELGSEIGSEVDIKIDKKVDEKLDDKLDEKIRTEIDTMQQERIPFFLKVLGCTVLSSAVGACTAIMFYLISQTEGENAPSDQKRDNNKQKLRNMRQNIHLNKGKQRRLIQTDIVKKIEYKDEQSEKEAEDFDEIGLDWQLIKKIQEDNEEKRKKDQKLEIQNKEVIEEESFLQEEDDTMPPDQSPEVNPMVDLLYRNREQSPALVKQMQGYNLNGQLLMEQLMRKDGSPVIVYLQECNDRKPLFLVDHNEDLWIHPIFTNLNEQGNIEISSMWYDTARIKNVFELCTMDFSPLTRVPQGRIRVADIVPAEIEADGEQVFVRKKGYLQVLN